MRIRLFIFFFLTLFSIKAQHFCYTTEAQNEWFKKHPELKAAFEQRQQEVALFDQQQLQQKQTTAGAIYTVPVVFHILHLGGNENISDAQIQNAVAILTRDYNKLNADTSNVVAAFKPNIGNTHFEFKLATIDPNGNCTNGIVRHWDLKTDWTGDFADYIYTWPPHKYMNVYVVRTMGNGAAGYTYLPGSGIPSNADAIVILNNYVGSIGTANNGSSRALTHEVGHWFSLPHTWGGSNQPGVACGDDGVNDTPITKGFNFCNLNNAIICTPGVTENVQNYMDYSYCSRMFTSGQSTRMQSCINNPINGRNNLSSVNNLSVTGISNPAFNCIPMVDILSSPAFAVCSGKNITVSSFTYNANPTLYVWSGGPGATVANPNLPTTTISFSSPGTQTITCTVSNSFGSNSKSVVVEVKNGIAEKSGTYSESFETPSLPIYWKSSNLQPALKWQVYQGAGSLGTQCVFVPGELMSANAEEILEGPSYDFKNNPGALYTFKYGYAKHNPNNNDVFKVQASKNCGGSWSDIYFPNTTTMANNSAGINSNLYVPFNEWVFYDLTQHPNFNTFLYEDNVRIRFYFKEDAAGVGYGNRLYLDEINYTTPTGINELTKAIQLQLIPNPTVGSAELCFTLSDESKVNLSLVNVSGINVFEYQTTFLNKGVHTITLNEKQDLPAGIYFVCLQLNGSKMVRKLVVQ